MNRRGRISLAEKVRKNSATLNLYASAAGQSVAVPAIPPKREALRKPSAQRSGADRLESDEQADIIEYLKTRSDVGGIVRHNSGQAVEGERRIRYNIVYGKHEGEYMRVTDIECVLKPSGRLCVIEVKRRGWTRPVNEREQQQAARIAHVRACGGVGFFATCVDDVREGLDSARVGPA